MKRLFALMLALMMVFAISACGDEASDSGSVEVSSDGGGLGVNTVLAKAIDAIDNISSFRMKVENSADITIMGRTETISVTGDAEFDVKGGLGFVDMNAKSGPLEMNTKGYIEIDGRVATVYAGLNGMWIRQSVPVVQLDSYGMGYNGVEGLKFYLRSFETEEMSNSGGEYLIKGHIVPEKTVEVLSGMGAGTQITASGINADFVSDMLDELKKIKISFRVDAGTFFVKKIEIDASDALNAIYDHIKTLATNDSVSMRVERNTAYVEYYDYNTPINIVIPDEVKNNN